MVCAWSGEDTADPWTAVQRKGRNAYFVTATLLAGCGEDCLSFTVAQCIRDPGVYIG